MDKRKAHAESTHTNIDVGVLSYSSSPLFLFGYTWVCLTHGSCCSDAPTSPNRGTATTHVGAHEYVQVIGCVLHTTVIGNSSVERSFWASCRTQSIFCRNCSSTAWGTRNRSRVQILHVGYGGGTSILTISEEYRSTSTSESLAHPRRRAGKSMDVAKCCRTSKRGNLRSPQWVYQRCTIIRLFVLHLHTRSYLAHYCFVINDPIAVSRYDVSGLGAGYRSKKGFLRT